MERHRLAYLVATTKVELDYSSVLHVAPESQLEKFLRSRAKDYLSIDLYAANVMAKMDLTALELDDETKSLVWVSHVLEHIEEDRMAIAEIYGVLEDSGTAIVQVPIWRDQTFEDPSVKTEEERLDAFYQRDHVRLYGLDIVERFEKVGFKVSVIKARDFGPETVIECGLSFVSTDEVFVLTK